MPRSSGPRAFIGALSLQVGPLSTTGRLVPLISTESREDNRFPLVCPECDDAQPVAQGYSCSNEHGPFTIGQCGRSRTLADGTLAKITEAQYKEARESKLTKDTFRATVHNAADAEGLIFDGDTAYVFQSPPGDQVAAVLTKLITETDKVFLSICNFRGNEALYRLMVWNGQLMLRKVLWPAQLNQFDAPTTEVDDALFGAAKGMIDRIVADFDVESYRSDTVARARALTASLQVGDVPEPESAAPAMPKERVDLLELLNAYAA